MFNEQHIQVAWTMLNRKGWLSTTSTRRAQATDN
jgi:hypothetical protein